MQNFIIITEQASQAQAVDYKSLLCLVSCCLVSAAIRLVFSLGEI